MGIWEGAKRASRGMVEGDPPAGYFVGGKQIVCEHCGHDEFDESATLWVNRGATTLMCDACGRIYLYGTKPERR